MTIDYIIALAGAIVSEHDRIGDETPQVALARAVLALLTPDKPCGWDAEFVVETNESRLAIRGNVDLTADEARWAAVEILRAAEKAGGEAK